MCTPEKPRSSFLKKKNQNSRRKAAQDALHSIQANVIRTLKTHAKYLGI